MFIVIVKINFFLQEKNSIGIRIWINLHFGQMLSDNSYSFNQEREKKSQILAYVYSLLCRV